MRLKKIKYFVLMLFTMLKTFSQPIPDGLTSGFLIQQPGGNTNKTQIRVSEVDIGSGAIMNELTNSFSISNIVNAFGYSEGYVYGIHSIYVDESKNQKLKILKVEKELTVSEFPDYIKDIDGSDLLLGPNVIIQTGDSDGKGNLYIMDGVPAVNDPTRQGVYKINIATNQVVGKYTRKLLAFEGLLDWGYYEKNGEERLYFVSEDGSLKYFTIKTDTDWGEPINLGKVVPRGAYGAGYFDNSNHYYISDNNNGNIYRIDIDTLETVLFSKGPKSNGNDGARNFRAAIQLDYGDAPDSYGTTLQNDGARHVYDGTEKVLGVLRDFEEDGISTIDAKGDDIKELADEDGVFVGVDKVLQLGGENEIPVSVSRGVAAKLAIWVDYNKDGIFDNNDYTTGGTGERYIFNIPTGNFNATQMIKLPTFSDKIKIGTTFLRARLYISSYNDIITPNGVVRGGEVEDYQIEIRDDFNISKTVQTNFPGDSSKITYGTNVQYTVVLKNNSTFNKEILLKDTLLDIYFKPSIKVYKGNIGGELLYQGEDAFNKLNEGFLVTVGKNIEEKIIITADVKDVNELILEENKLYENVATGNGKNSCNIETEDCAPVTPAKPGFTIEKSVQAFDISNNPTGNKISEGYKVNYTVVVKNTTNAIATDVLVSDDLTVLKNAKGESIYERFSATLNGTQVNAYDGKIVTIPRLEANGLVTLVLTAYVKAGLTFEDGEIIENVASINQEKSCDIDVETCAPVTPEIPGFTVAKSVRAFDIGNNPTGNKISESYRVEYILTVRNTSNAPAINVVVEDDLTTIKNQNNELIYQNFSATLDGIEVSGYDGKIVTIPRLEAKGMAEIILRAYVRTGLTFIKEEQIENVASIGQEKSCDISVETCAPVTPEGPSFTIQKNVLTFDTENVTRGNLISEGYRVEYTVMVRNTSNAPAINVVVEDDLTTIKNQNNELIYQNFSATLNGVEVSGYDGKIVTIPRLEANTDITLKLIAYVKTGLNFFNGEKIGNIAIVEDKKSCDLSIENCAPVTPAIPGFLIEKTVQTYDANNVSKGNIISGNYKVEYTVIVRNTGNAPAINVVVEDDLTAIKNQNGQGIYERFGAKLNNNLVINYDGRSVIIPKLEAGEIATLVLTTYVKENLNFVDGELIENVATVGNSVSCDINISDCAPVTPGESKLSITKDVLAFDKINYSTGNRIIQSRIHDKSKK